MSLAVVHTRALTGVSAPAVEVEVHLSGGLPNLSIVGLPEAAVKESKDRVRAAILNANFKFPAQRITVNLAPADLPKDGGRYDLPIALGILSAAQQLPTKALVDLEFIGELALGGELRPVRGALPSALATRDAGRSLVLPHANGFEAALATGARIHTANTLLQVCGHLTGRHSLPTQERPVRESPASDTSPDLGNLDLGEVPDLRDVKGQFHAKRALEIAAAGAHNLLLIGPPGTGKSMLASRLPGILPPMSEDEALETASIASISARGFSVGQWRRRGFRAPHHTASGVALVGGGSLPRPGEISLAHNGVLFLDELPEFDRRVLDVLREPMESGRITISRAARQAEFPARFQLVGAMNPCPCGNHGDPLTPCRCTPDQRARYRGRLSGPFLDRIDMHIEVPRVSRESLRLPDPNAESSMTVRQRVCKARQVQIDRAGKSNAALTTREMERHCRLDEDSGRLLDTAMDRLQLSARAYHRILKVARTIADLDGSELLKIKHVTEAISYRKLDMGATRN